MEPRLCHEYQSKGDQPARLATGIEQRDGKRGHDVNRGVAVGGQFPSDDAFRELAGSPAQGQDDTGRRRQTGILAGSKEAKSDHGGRREAEADRYRTHLGLDSVVVRIGRRLIRAARAGRFKRLQAEVVNQARLGLMKSMDDRIKAGLRGAFAMGLDGVSNTAAV